jgi:Fe-S oxidoreductase
MEYHSTQFFVIKALFVAALLTTGFGYFFYRVRYLIVLMQAVKGRRSFAVDRLPERVRVLFTDILGQTNVRRKWAPGLAHTLIFFGFLAVQPHSFEMMIQGLFHQFSVAHIFPGFYGVYLAVADVLGFLVLLGLGYGLYRRTIVKPGYLTNGFDAKMVILFTSVIIITFHFYNAFHLVLPMHGFDYDAYFTVSAAVSQLFGLSGLSETARYLGLEFFYWLHLLTIVGFMIYIPRSKHLHLLASIPNVFYKPLDIEKPMLVTDIENEEAESFGLAKLDELNWKQVLDLYACTECGRCEERCPASNTGKPLSPKGMIHNLKVDLLANAENLIKENGEAIPALIDDERGPLTREAIWACTTCRGCEDICPVNIQHLDIILEARKHQVLMEADFPSEMQDTFSSIENQYNPWGFPAENRAAWCKDLKVKQIKDDPEADILWFVGCAGSYEDSGIRVSRAIAGLLNKAGVRFAILGEEERCNGDLARRCGNEYLAQMMIRENVEIINSYKPKRILTGCPHCFNTLKVEYPQFGATYDVVHHADFLLELVEAGRLHINPAALGKLTFHDSCYLGRWNGIYNSPRQLLTVANQGEAPLEMTRHHDDGMCCGAGGARMFMEEVIGTRINNERAGEAITTGADTVVAACPFCITMLNDGVRDGGGKMKVRDLAEVLDEVCV